MLIYVPILMTLFIHDISNEELSMAEIVGDTLATGYLAFGEPINEDTEYLNKLYCNSKPMDNIAKQVDKIKFVSKGTILSLIETVAQNFNPKSFIYCKLIEKGENEKVVKLVKQYNKHVEEHKKLAQQIITVLEEAAQKDTKTTFPMLACYLKEIHKKLMASVPETDGAREVMERGTALIFELAIKDLEKIHGKAIDGCQLLDAKPIEAEYRSVFVPLARAYNNLDKNVKIVTI